jgi:hypothetical protein
MGNLNELLLASLAVGVGATLVMDIWALLLQRVLAIPSLSYCLVGRWLGYMPSGVFYHTKITAAAPRSGECVLGWSVHYLIGIIYAGLLLIPSNGIWLEWLSDNALQAFAAAVAVGLVTIVFPFLVMQPALGFGFAAAKNPHPVRARFKTLMTHSVFGVGLYVSGCGYLLFLAALK